MSRENNAGYAITDQLSVGDYEFVTGKGRQIPHAHSLIG